MKSDGHHTTVLMLDCLRSRDDKLCDNAAAEIEWLHEYIKKLERRIRKQRVALRENWEIVEMRAGYKHLPEAVASRMLRAWCARARECDKLKKLLANGQSADKEPS